MNNDVIIYQDDKNIEEGCKEQIRILSESEAYKGCKIRIMPDCHTGVSSCIGFTCQFEDKVIPATIGVDIGCGMIAIKLEGINESSINFPGLDNFIKNHIPSGRNIRNNKIVSFPKITHLRCYKELKDSGNFEKALGTLGGG